MVTRNIIERLTILNLCIVQYVWCCSETINLSQELTSISINSPNFGTNQLYPLNINCKWNIKSPNNTSLYLVFHSFDLEYNQYCSWDYVAIQDGVCSTSGNRYCGTIIPSTFQANSGLLCIEFNSDVVIAKKGFNATVTISEPAIDDTLSTIPVAPCQSTSYIINSTILITSPNFQIQQNYPNNAHCQWIIVPDQHAVTIHFKAFDVENHPNCGYDSLKIYNGSSTEASEVSTYCGTDIPTPFTVNSTTLIIFSSDFVVPKAGFKALITFHDEANAETTLGPEVTTTMDMNGGITSTTANLKTAQVVPGFHTNVVMTLPTSSQMTPNLFLSTKSSSNSITSTTTAGPSTTAELMASTAVQNIVTDASVSQLANKQVSTLPSASISYIPSVPVVYEMCSQSVVQVSEELFIQSPNYGYLKQYPLNVNCELVFNTSTDNILEVEFMEMDVENHYTCKWDKVIVYDGNTSLNPILDTICGQRKPVLNSTANILTIQFISDHVVRRKGFKATVRAIKRISTEPSSTPSLTHTISSTTSTSSTALSATSTATPTSLTAPSTTFPALSTGSLAPSTSTTTTSTSSVASTSSPALSTNSLAPSTSPTTTLTSSVASTNSPTLSTGSLAPSTSSTTTSTSSTALSATSTATPTSSTAPSTTSPALSTGSLAPSTTSTTIPTYSKAPSTTLPALSTGSLAPSTSSSATTVVSTSLPNLSTTSSATSTSSTSLLTTSSAPLTGSKASKSSSYPPTISSASPTNSPGTSTSLLSTLLRSSTTSPARTQETSSSSSPTSSTITTTRSSTSSPAEGPVSICDQTHLFINDTLSLTSPNYGKGRQYPKNVDCGLSMTTNSNQYFYITIQDFALEVHPNCSWDYLAVYNGDTSNGTRIGKFCGYLHNHTIVSATNHLFFRFYSDDVVPKAGFRAIIKVKTSYVTETTKRYITTTVETVKSPVSTTSSITEILTTPKPDADILASACAGVPMVLNISPSTIESPGYLDSPTYANDMDCQWVIESPVDKLIHLMFISFDVEHQELCEWDSLSVYDGASSSSNLLIGSYCGNTKPPNITSTGSTLFIKFITDRMVGKQGFQIEVSFINSTNVTTNNCKFKWLPCSSKGNCLPKEWFCDGEQDCFDNEDENNCDSCKVDEIPCYDGSCLPQYQRCDGIPQCSDAEDEDNCTSISTDGRLLVMKSSKWFPVCHDNMWSNDSAHAACTSLGRPGYISFGSQYSEVKTYAVASTSPSDTDTSFSKQFSLSSSCPSGHTVTLQCREKICGIVSENIPQAFIVGGSQSAVGEWPWMVAVMSGQNHICGGTIISDQWILTAGHCISGIQHSPQSTSVIVGATNLKGGDVQYRKVSEMILHPEYNFIYFADLGLMRLRQPLVFSSTIRPLCLPTRLHTWSPSLPCYIAGWGATSLQDAALQETRDDLHHAKVKVWPRTKCESAYPNKMKDFMLCAGYEYGHIDACKGDSGGPLMCKVGDENNWVFAGITSWGEGCGGVNKPGVYTKVDYYRQWVLQMTQRTDKSIGCNFETPDMCGYIDQSNSTLMWTRRSGGLNDPSRPLTDVTFNSQQGSFMYAFIPYEERGNSATLMSPSLDLTGEQCLTFWFNFHGDIDAVFKVYGLKEDNTTKSLVQFSQMYSGWRHAEVDLTTDTRRILFHVQSALKYNGGVALDDMNISNTSCVGVTKLTCNFDGGTLCNYQQAEDDSDDWQIKVHPLSNVNSRSAATQKDHYLEVNGTNRSRGTVVKLLSPPLNSTVPKCLSFKYKISPIGAQKLSVCTVSKYEGNFYSNCHYWVMSSSVNNTWTLAHAQIPPVYQPFQIGFQATRGIISGIVAVDDISRTDGNCS